MSNSKKNILCFSIIIHIFLSSCSSVNTSSSANTTCIPPKIYIVFQANSKKSDRTLKSQKLAVNFLDRIYKKKLKKLRKINEDIYIYIDMITEKENDWVFSDPLKSLTRKENAILIDKIYELDSKEEFLPDVFERIKNLTKENADQRKFYAYVVGSGTSDRRIIEKIEEIIERLASDEIKSEKLRIFLILTNNEKRMKPVFSRIDKQVEVTGATIDRWKRLIDDVENCNN